jgi:hypothetical protein
VSKSSAKIIAPVFRTEDDELSGTYRREKYIIRSVTIYSLHQIFKVMILERVARIKRMITTHKTINSKGKSNRKF